MTQKIKETRVEVTVSFLTDLYELCRGRAEAYHRAGMHELSKLYYDRAHNLRYTLEYIGNML